MRKMIGKRKLTGAERVQRSVELGNDITERLNEARAEINWKRRRKAEKSLLSWLSTYGVGVFVDDVPDGHLPEVVNDIQNALTLARPYQVLMPRKHGKTSYIAGAAAWMICAGRCKFLVVLGANLDAAKSIVKNIYLLTATEPFKTDYPDVCIPIEAANGASKRRITYRGKPVNFEKTAKEIVFPTLEDEHGAPVSTSNVCVRAAGIKSGIRGMRHYTHRPDVVLLDDLQTKDSARNPERVQELFEIITRDVSNLGGKRKLSCLMAATVICPDDLAEKIRNTPAWKTTFFQAFLKWPKDWTDDPKGGLWAQYFALFDAENARGADNHDKSLAFYKANRAAMDKGADVLTPSKYDEEHGQISTVQAYMDKMHEDGYPSFSAEFQMVPDRGHAEIVITPRDVLAKCSEQKALTVPDGFTFVAAATDLNVSYALTTDIVAFRRDLTAFVLFHETYPCRIDGKLSDTEYYAAVYSKLTEYGERLASFGLPIDVWGIDCNGTPFNAVTDFAKASRHLCGIPAVGMRGAASHKYNPLTRSRIADDINGSLVNEERGRRWIWFDGDAKREQVQLSLLAKFGAAGGCTLYEDASRARDEFALQVCNEKLIGKWQRDDGRTEYRWKSAEPHDHLDALGMAFALAGRNGMSAAASKPTVAPVRAPIRRRPRVAVI